MNLAANAIKYNRRGGGVAFSREKPTPDAVRIIVADTGAGIAPESLERLFTPFDRLGAERSGEEGTGLGLALSKRLVELISGDRGVESEVDKGTTFFIDLEAIEQPVSKEDAATTLRPKRPAVGGLDRTVLYVEDNPSNVRLMERIKESGRDSRRSASGRC